MKFALGTFEITDEQAKVIAKDLGKRGSYVKRDEARDWALGLITGRISALVAGAGVPATSQSADLAEVGIDENDPDLQDVD